MVIIRSDLFWGESDGWDMKCVWLWDFGLEKGLVKIWRNLNLGVNLLVDGC